MLRGNHIYLMAVLAIACSVSAQSNVGIDDIYSSNRAPVPLTKIDKLVLPKVKRAGYQPKFCTDHVFCGGPIWI